MPRDLDPTRVVQGGDAAQLLQRLLEWPEHPGGYTAVVLVSLGMLPVEAAAQPFWLDVDQVMSGVRSRHGVILYELSLADRAFLAHITDYNEVSLMTGLKVDLLRLVEKHFPEQFGQIDQTRLIRMVRLRSGLPRVVRFLEHYRDPLEPLGRGEPTRRRLRDDDIERVREVFRRLGAARFAQAFVRRQRMAVIEPGRPLRAGPPELYVSMEDLKRHVFPDVELRGSGNRFNQLTVVLDRFLLEGFAAANPQGKPCSINLNVESVFTHSFEYFLKELCGGQLAGLTFEFRQGNIVQNFDEFDVAGQLIRARGGQVAVDSVFPETVGVVNVDRLGAAWAKVFWRQGSETVLPDCADDVRAFMDGGTTVTLARVDDRAAIALGQRIGITAFQGFAIDDLLAARH